MSLRRTFNWKLFTMIACAHWHGDHKCQAFVSITRRAIKSRSKPAIDRSRGLVCCPQYFSADTLKKNKLLLLLEFLISRCLQTTYSSRQTRISSGPSACDASLFRRAEVFFFWLTRCSGDHEASGKKSAARDDKIFSTWSTASNIHLGAFSTSLRRINLRWLRFHSNEWLVPSSIRIIAQVEFNVSISPPLPHNWRWQANIIMRSSFISEGAAQSSDDARANQLESTFRNCTKRVPLAIKYQS